MTIFARGAAVAFIFVGITFGCGAPAYADSVQEVDYAGVETVVVLGEGSKVVLSAKDQARGDLRIVNGGWSSLLCGGEAAVSRDGPTLNISLTRTGTSLLGQCDITLALDMPEHLNLTLNQAETVAQINGVYATVQVKSKDAVVEFSGQASRVDIEGDDVAVRLAFTSAQDMDGVRINASKLVADVGFQPGTALSYVVNARQSSFSPEFPNTEGARPMVEINSGQVEGSIYVLK